MLNKGTSDFTSYTLLILKQDLLMVFIKYKKLIPTSCSFLAIRLCSNRQNSSSYHRTISSTTTVSTHSVARGSRPERSKICVTSFIGGPIPVASLDRTSVLVPLNPEPRISNRDKFSFKVSWHSLDNLYVTH